MNEKRKAVLDAAMVLFATKGYHSASIQEIADRAGISKGSVYSYFSSKNELLVEIYRHYYEIIKKKMGSYQEYADLHPKERLQLQIKVYFEELLRRKEFILMHINENVRHSKELEEFLVTVQMDIFHWYEQSLKSIYGDKVGPYIIDLSIILRGMIESYILTLFSTKTQVSFDDLTAFIVSRLDDLVEGLVRKQEPPSFDDPGDLLASPLFGDDGFWRKELHRDLMQLESIVLDAEIKNETKRDCLESIELLKEEARQDKPKKVIFKGLLTNLAILPETNPISKKILMSLEKID